MLFFCIFALLTLGAGLTSVILGYENGSRIAVLIGIVLVMSSGWLLIVH